MDAAQCYLTGQISSAAISHGARQRFRNSFGSASTALLLAMGLPIIVFLFGTIRAREFQLAADPRWAAYAPFVNRPVDQVLTSLKTAASKQTTDSDETPIQTVEAPVQTASIRTAGSSALSLVRRSTMETNMTGSVTGHRSFEVPVRGEAKHNSDSETGDPRVQRERSERKSTGLRADDDDSNTAIIKYTRRIELQVIQVRQRLDQLAKTLSEHLSEDFQHQVQILEQQKQLMQREAELQIALNELSQATKSKALASTAAETVSPEPQLVQETGATTPSNEDSSGSDVSVNDVATNEDPIRIRRSIGRDMIDVFTMDVQDADIRQFIDRLSAEARVGILASPAVQGQISMHLHKVRLESALKAIARSCDFVVERESGIVVVRTAEEVTRQKSQTGKLAHKPEGVK